MTSTNNTDSTPANGTVAGNGSTTSNGTTSGPVVCVFCGAYSGSSESFQSAARDLAHALHRARATLIYGGGNTGLMGTVAKTLISLSGPKSVKGIIPQALLGWERKGGHHDDHERPSIEDLSFGETVVVKDMHERKNLMAQEVIRGGPGSGFVALAGGYGTFEELMEMATWNQLGIHDKGIVVYNVEGYWDSLFAWVRNAVACGFVSGENRDIMIESTTADGVLDALARYELSKGRLQLKWNEK